MAGIQRGGGNPTTAPQGSGNVGREGKGSGLMGMRSAGAGAGGMEPTTVYLVILVIAEILLYGAARYYFKDVHGG